MKTINDFQVGDVVTGTVANIVEFGAFINIDMERDALVHISEIAEEYVSNVQDFLEIGQEVQVKVIEIDQEKGHVKLSIKQAA